jgi:hypothetical protein
VALVFAGREEARDRELGQGGAVHVVGALLDEDPLLDGAARRHPADPQAAPDRLRERVDVDHVAVVLGAQSRRASVVEAEVAVDPVLDDEEAVAARELEQALAPALGEVEAGRVVAARLHRQEADLLAAEHRLQRIEVESLGIHRDRQDSGPD